jgi:phage FluMu gp28-like protein
MCGLYILEIAKRGAACAWVSPIYKTSRPLWRFCEATVNPQVVEIHKSEREIEFPGGGRIGIYSADNDVSIRGEAFDLVVVDEAAQVKEETYSDVLLPTLADRNGRIILISTPKGRNWFYQEWVKANEIGTAWHAPTNANPLPNIQRAYELAKTRVSQRTFKQEWDAEFIEDSGLVFRRVREAATAQLTKPQPGAQYVIGVDWGRTNDATVFCVLEVNGKSVVALDRMTDTDYNLQRVRLAALAKRYNATVLAESNAMGLPNIEQLQKEGVSVQAFNTTNASKAEIIDALILAFEQGDIKILNDPILVNELESYESERLPSGMTRYSAPEGMHDDCVIALALAYRAASSGDELAYGQSPTAHYRG